MNSLGHGRSHNLAPADDDGLGSGDLDARPPDEFHAAGGGARHEAGLHVARCQLALVHRPQAVHVLVGRDPVRNCALVDPAM